MSLVVILILQAIVFAIWTYAMFRMLFTVHRIAADDTGKALPGPIAFLAAFTAWLHDPALRMQRKVLFVSFLVLVGLTIAVASQRSAL